MAESSGLFVHSEVPLPRPFRVQLGKQKERHVSSTSSRCRHVDKLALIAANSETNAVQANQRTMMMQQMRETKLSRGRVLRTDEVDRADSVLPCTVELGIDVLF